MKRVSVVTGGAQGIGAAIVRRLAADGDSLVLVDIDAMAAEATAGEIAAAGGTVRVVLGDVSADQTVAEVAETVAGLGRLDVLVNNVGDFRPASKTFGHSTPEQWQRLYEVNLLHVFKMCHALVPRMIEQGHGAVVNVSTVEAFRGIPGHAVYSAYNAGVSAFTKSLAVEVGEHGVRVNAVAPDLTDTPQTSREAMLRGRDPGLLRSWLPLGRFGQPEDFAGVVAFLASPDAGFITGHTIPVDGGTLAASGWYAREDHKGWTNMPNHP
ncbi:SDR family NAD(P)-dependent oxidoreductase [Nocardioides sp. AE5]|uniref:SDR family NAD(P)-dependent oxidoreductase n=1 Tax=Nocardioides sp. AE5 TaxID=2962573 RepID=UPI002880E4B4|nr:SDR family NAD(P)-dependent oxidoreductase [Nocardioides sp. AE5]MDT0203216.1 SDR family NAD(P)-dependent oxidoreductase [Nocardioides sp. AE5]